jgi:hypothetical protein
VHLARYDRIPDHNDDRSLIEVRVDDLQPTQMCVGLAEVRSRQRDFSLESRKERLDYLRGKPVPLVRNRLGQLWMVDRHHRLRALLEMDPEVTTYGYVVAELESEGRDEALTALQQRGWLYLHDGRGNGPWGPAKLPRSLLGLEDDPYRSLVWKLKQEGVIKPQRLIPYHEFRWGAWLRTRPLPPFSSAQLDPALPASRCLAQSAAASHLAGWTGKS